MNLIHRIKGVNFKDIGVSDCFVTDYTGTDVYMKTRGITNTEGHPINAVSLKYARYMWFKDDELVYPASVIVEYDY